MALFKVPEPGGEYLSFAGSTMEFKYLGSIVHSSLTSDADETSASGQRRRPLEPCGACFATLPSRRPSEAGFTRSSCWRFCSTVVSTYTQPAQLFAAGAQLATHTQPTLRTGLMAHAWRLLHVPRRVIIDAPAHVHSARAAFCYWSKACSPHPARSADWPCSPCLALAPCIP